MRILDRLSTLHREYAALVALQHYDYADIILHPRLEMKPVIPESEIQNTMAAYNVNQPQAVAITSVMRTDGFSLIQGYASPCLLFPVLTVFMRFFAQSARYWKDVDYMRPGAELHVKSPPGDDRHPNWPRRGAGRQNTTQKNTALCSE